jgi:hypothetical protein
MYASQVYGFGSYSPQEVTATGGRTTASSPPTWAPGVGAGVSVGLGNPLIVFLVLALLFVGYLHFGFNVKVGN